MSKRDIQKKMVRKDRVGVDSNSIAFRIHQYLDSMFGLDVPKQHDWLLYTGGKIHIGDMSGEEKYKLFKHLKRHKQKIINNPIFSENYKIKRFGKKRSIRTIEVS